MRRLLAICVLLFGVASFANAQNVRYQSYYESCGQFFEAGNLESAFNSCQISLAAKADYAPALRLKARIQLAQNQASEAKITLEQAKINDTLSPENDLLDAEIAFALGNANQAVLLSSGMTSSPNPGFQQRAIRVLGEAQLLQGRSQEAIITFKQLLDLQPNNLEIRRFLAQAMLEHDPRAAVSVLRQASNKPPLLLADLGRAKWIAGDLKGAILNLEAAVASPAAFRNEPKTYRKALGALAYSYFGQGRISEGQRVLTQIGDTLGLFLSATNHVLPWLLGALLLLILHLIGESRIEPLSTIEIEDGPRPWTVTSIYRWLLLAAVTGLLVSLLAGQLLYGNLLAILTPVQSSVARDVYFGVFALVLVGMAFKTAHGLGWDTRELLLGSNGRGVAVDGVVLGLVLVALTLGYAFVAHLLKLPNSFYIDLNASRLSLFLPLLLLPLSELFFRAYAVYPLEKRYGLPLTYGILSLMYALSFGTPVLLLAGAGAILLAFTNRLRSSTPAVVSQWVYYVALLVVMLTIPAVRTWF